MLRLQSGTLNHQFPLMNVGDTQVILSAGKRKVTFRIAQEVSTDVVFCHRTRARAVLR